MIIYDKNNRINKPEDIANILQSCLKLEDKIDQEKEHFYTICLNSRNNIILIDLVSVGTLNSSLIHPRETYRRAIMKNACKIMIAHNHPTGETNPSEADIEITQRLKKAGQILDIELIDHIIFSLNNHYSFKQRNLL